MAKTKWSDPAMLRLIDNLKDEHRILAGMMAELADMVSAEAPADPQALFDLRRRFRSELTAHIHGEEWVLYPRLRASGDAALAALADRFTDERAGLIERLEAHVQSWTSLRIAADWTGYRAAALAILAMLLDWMLREDDELYAAAAGLRLAEVARAA